MIMGAAVLRRYIEPLLDPRLDHIESIRIGSKSLAYWPQRFVSDPDADDTLRLFEQVVKSGRALAFMAHFSHPRELEPPLVAEAVRRIRATGAVIRTQAPLIRSINDDPRVWSAMWRSQIRMGMVPYYMFVERDTGPQDYFAVPLARGYEIFRDAYRSVSGLCRTVRGPSMSATPGKLCVDGVVEVAGQQVFVLHMIQARDPGAGRRAVLRPVRPGTPSGCRTWSPRSPRGSRSSPHPEELPGRGADRACQADRALPGGRARLPDARQPPAGPCLRSGSAVAGCWPGRPPPGTRPGPPRAAAARAVAAAP